MSLLRDSYIKVIFSYYITILILLVFIPFIPAVIPLLFIPVVYVTFISEFKYSILLNMFFLIIVCVYEGIGREFNLNQQQFMFLVSGAIFSFIVIILINFFKNYYQKKNQEINESMEKLAASYRDLETTQSKLMALTWITRELLGVQSRNNLTKKIINLLNKYMLYENIAFLKLEDNQIEDVVKLGFEDKVSEDLRKFLNIEIHGIDHKEVRIIDGDFLKKGTKIMYAPIYEGEDLKDILIILQKTDWIDEQDKYVMNILLDHINLLLDKIKLIEDTHKLAVTDEGTNLYNQRYFYDKLKELFNKAKKNDYCLSIVIFDIDNFKQINDQYGHLVGDKILEEMGQLLSNHFRNNDILARYGGDEFVLILPMADREISYKISQRIVELIDGYDFITDEGKIISTSISGGIATYPDYDVEEPIELVKKADQALYNSKRNGKNQVMIGIDEVN